jgi:hypothetical protein
MMGGHALNALLADVAFARKALAAVWHQGKTTS